MSDIGVPGDGWSDDMNRAACFDALSPETWSAVARFECKTGKHLADEIEERDEKMVRLFLILHGYPPREIQTPTTPLPVRRLAVR